MNRVAESYVKLALAAGQHDPDFVDAYYGPPAWQTAIRLEEKSPEQIKRAALSLILELKGMDTSRSGHEVQLRHALLLKRVAALLARIEVRGGRSMGFDEEAKALYDVIPPVFPESHFARILERLEALLPGKGSILQRYERLRSEFTIPSGNLATVFSAALSEARRRTKSHIRLPARETLEIEYVNNRPWSGYNWYRGNYASLIQVNTDPPICIERALDLACHEGYPGHHVQNVLFERNLLKKRKWVEFSLSPLFSPQSLVAEGSANFGIEVAFPGAERAAFEYEVLFPIAGLDPFRARQYYRVAAQVRKLNYAVNEAARHYLDGRRSARATLRWLETYALMAPNRARQRLQFIDRYRSYVVNYNLGLDLVRKHIHARGGTGGKPERRWQEFQKLLSMPCLPSMLLR
jgi:hypothetical protein